jgi:RNA polymerase sigma-70 factor (ECF subfamily)
VNSYPKEDPADFLALQAGDDTALSRVMSRWERPLLAFAWRYLRNSTDAHDLVSEAFVRLYQQRHRLRSDTKLSAWLFTALANLCHNHHRWRSRHPTVSMDATTENEEGSVMSRELPSPGQAPAASAERSEELQLLDTAINALPHDLKASLLLHHYEQLSYREIAGIVGCSERGVETRIYRAKNQLRAALAAHHPAALKT